MRINRVRAGELDKQHYELVIIGSGFGSCFFLVEALRHIKGRALIVEWGDFHAWDWQIENQKSSVILPESTYDNPGKKPWNTTIALGAA